MPRGTGYVIAALFVVIAFIGGIIWWSMPDKPKSTAEKSGGKAVQLEVEGPQTAGGADTAAADRRTEFTRFIDPEDRFEPGELIVIDPPEGFQIAARGLGFSVSERIRLSELGFEIFRMRIPAGASVPEARTLLRSRFPGLAIDANHQYEAQALEDYLDRTPRALIGWKKATPTCGAGIEIGMIDSAVDVKHPALAGQNIDYRSFHKEGRRPGKADHGTAVAAILVGKPKWGGLLPGAALKAANMFEVNEVGRDVGNAVGLLKAMEWLIKERVHVINLSVAGANNKAIRLAVKQALSKRQVMVAAAGNWGREDKPAYPAAYKATLAITALGKNNTIYADANRGAYIDFAAPGVQIYTAVPQGGRLQSGTSFAAPFLSVLIAIQIAAGVGDSPTKLRAALRGVSVDLGETGKDKVFGWGAINAQPRCD